MSIIETTIESFDGTRLYSSKNLVSDAKAGVVIVHGLVSMQGATTI